MRSIIYHAFLALCIIGFLQPDAQAQCNTQVTHGSGTQSVGGSNVTVTSSGMTNLYTSYCPGTTQPYFIGYSWSLGSGPGEFVFNFSPAISGVRLNFSGASNSGGSIEEIRLHVNGAHYAMPSVGSNNACDPMAILTAAGDLQGCPNCGVSGWSGTTISGSISSLRVEDFVVGGTPNGSLFSLFICNVILPADWISFTANPVEDRAVQLQWITENEINNDEFSVERSVDGENWAGIGTVDAAGNADSQTEYGYWDDQPVAGLSYYRIRQTNLDGASSHSDVQMVRMGSAGRTSVYPNPADRELFITSPDALNAAVSLRNHLGQLVEVSLSRSSDRIRLNTAMLSEGIYLLEIKTDSAVETHKVIVE